MNIEIIALKNFVLKQFFIVTKSLPEPNDLVNEAQKDYIKPLLDHIEYLKEENKMKTTIIVSLGHSIDINNRYLNNSNCSMTISL